MGKNAQYHGTKSRITLYSLQLIVARQPRILKSKKRDVFEKEVSIIKVSKKNIAFNVSQFLTQ